MDDFDKDYTWELLEKGIQFVFPDLGLTGHRNISEQGVFYDSIVEIVRRNQGRFNFEELVQKFMEDYLVIDDINYSRYMVGWVANNEDIWGKPFITEGFRKELAI